MKRTSTNEFKSNMNKYGPNSKLPLSAGRRYRANQTQHNHTPGPWCVTCNGNNAFTIRKDGTTIAQINGQTFPLQAAENAMLISDAPTLLYDYQTTQEGYKMLNEDHIRLKQRYMELHAITEDLVDSEHYTHGQNDLLDRWDKHNEG